jgi:putative transposase
LSSSLAASTRASGQRSPRCLATSAWHRRALQIWLYRYRIDTGKQPGITTDIDAFAGTIVGWACSLRHDTRLVERALRMAEGRRAREGHPRTGRTIHHSDAGSAYTALHCGASLLLAGMVASIGSVADAYDNALAETTIGLDTTECLRPGSPFARGPLASLTDLEEVTSAWVHWYNTARLMHHLGRRPPVEVEQEYSGRRAAESEIVHT